MILVILVMNFMIENFNVMYLDWFIFNIVVFGIFFMMGIFGNSFVFYLYIVCVFYIDEWFFIFFFGVVDLFVCLWLGMFVIILNFYCVDFLLVKLCKVMYFFLWGFINYFVLFFLIIVFYRYKKICRLVFL